MTDQKKRRTKSEKTKMREFGLTVGIAFGVLAALLFWRGRSNYVYLAVISAIFILTGLVVPRILKPVNKVWMMFSIALGWVMTRVILTVLFFAVFTPIGLIARFLARKEFLDLKMGETRDSYWNYREQTELAKSDYERQF
jgi:hypothetical protein